MNVFKHDFERHFWILLFLGVHFGNTMKIMTALENGNQDYFQKQSEMSKKEQVKRRFHMRQKRNDPGPQTDVTT